MPGTFIHQKEEKSISLLEYSSIGNDSPTQNTNVDSAVDMTFPEAIDKELAKYENPNSESKMNLHNISSPSVNRSNNHPGMIYKSTIVSDSARIPISVVNGMPYSFEHLMEMGNALAKARRERAFPTTITPNYNIQAVIDDYQDLQRLNIAREAESDTRDHAFRPDISRLYIEIQRKIQDRDLTQGEVAAEANVRARLGGFANSTGAETGMYNLMRHAVQSVLRLNHLTPENGDNLVDSAATRVVNEIRTTVQSQAIRGAHGVTEKNMDIVMEQVFSAIENALSHGVGTQANRLDGQINNMSTITNAQNAQVNTIAIHVGAIDNHVHALGNNVNAMSSLVNSTNGNVTALTTNVGSLQTVVNMIPQMASNAIRDMLPGIIGPAVETAVGPAVGTAVEKAFENAISNELIARLQVFAHAVQEARTRAEIINNPYYRTSKTTKRRSWFGFFRKHYSHRKSCIGPAY
ncbi:hypothetical protein FHL15_008673 [Xylaria flabelliformis]|uniref:Uncharacterized protein n=1 Tax=Xylaria flabelliformis TaxID=2512241 RepID=A0A553HRC3_9PEZI|nr:hypothetical protein FHL15_008673 [Xylaria flabelliformis]